MPSRTPLFIIPHWSSEIEQSKYILEKTITSIINQTDKDWKILIVDDASPDEFVRDYLLGLKEKLTSKKFDVIFETNNCGAGKMRNVGIDYALEHMHPFILFNDDDDLSDLRRVECVRRVFDHHADVDVVYNNFIVINEFDNILPDESLSPSIKEIACTNSNSPPAGNDMWLKMGLHYGYSNLTSATAVRTHLAAKCKFPPKRISEDYHTWLRYGSFGKKFYFLKDIVTKYRIVEKHKGSTASRERSEDFYYEKVKADNQGFLLALKNAMAYDNELDAFDVMKRFNMRSCITALRENRIDLANDLLRRANIYNKKSLKGTSGNL